MQIRPADVEIDRACIPQRRNVLPGSHSFPHQLQQSGRQRFNPGLKDDDTAGFDLISDICGVDWIKTPEKRFELVYNFYSVAKNQRVLIRTFIPNSDNPKVRSIQPIYSGADWMEREVYDMLGIEFEGHPDLRRIITPDGFEGWPHRKDFPLMYELPQFSHNKDNPPEIVK